MRSALRAVRRHVALATDFCCPLTRSHRGGLTASSVSHHHFRHGAAGLAVAGSPRSYATLTRPLRQSWKSRSLRPWMCTKESCRFVNHESRKECESCGAAKPQLLGWKCVGCSTTNFAGVRKCKKCGEASEGSKDFWMCAVCRENNRVDEIEDNSRCGFCGYDMAPPSIAEEEILRRAKERAMALQQQQEHFDAVSYKEADEQFSNPLEGAEALDPSLQATHPGVEVQATSRLLKIPPVAPFVPRGVSETRHSPLHRRKNVNTALQTVLGAAASSPDSPPGFDWMCRNSSCGHINPGDEEGCLKCGTHITSAEWECPLCAALNHPTRSRCFHCKSRIPVCWTCTACQGTTSIYDKACRGCGMERPAAEPRSVREVERGGSNRVGAFVPQSDKARGEWYCSQCNGLNFARRTECFQCSAPRPAALSDAATDPFSATGWGEMDGAGAAGVAVSVQSNNWICAYCQASNFRTRHDCWKCGRASERAEEWCSDAPTPQYEHEGFQEGAASKSEGRQTSTSWKAATGEWMCAKCYSKNFKKRLECFRCGTRKLAVSPRGSAVRRPVKL